MRKERGGRRLKRERNNNNLSVFCKIGREISTIKKKSRRRELRLGGTRISEEQSSVKKY